MIWKDNMKIISEKLGLKEWPGFLMSMTLVDQMNVSEDTVLCSRVCLTGYLDFISWPWMMNLEGFERKWSCPLGKPQGDRPPGRKSSPGNFKYEAGVPRRSVL